MPELSRENLEKQSASEEEENLEMKKNIEIIEIEEELIKDYVKEESQKEKNKKKNITPEGLAQEWTKKYGGKCRNKIDENPEFLKDKEKIKEELYKEKIH